MNEWMDGTVQNHPGARREHGAILSGAARDVDGVSV
jgi:hypothetical protein